MGTLWRNSDGLTVQYGTRDAQANVARSPKAAGEYKELVLHINDATALDTAVGADDSSMGGVIPAGAHITDATLYVTTAFTSGGSATLSIGTYGTDDGAAVDADGIDATIAVASLTDNAEIACDGAQVDTTLAEAVRVHALYGTAAFTAGKGKVVIRYIMQAA